LRVAADYGKVEIVRIMVEHDANVGGEDNNGRTSRRRTEKIRL
jgi:hypothetical protein